MKTKKLDVALIFKQVEDQLVPRLRFSLVDRAVYCHLFRHTHLEGKSQLSFSIPWLARGTRVCGTTARKSLRRLVAKGALLLVERTRAGHAVEVRLPEEIGAAACFAAPRPSSPNLEEMDFLQPKPRRELIHARERGRCFYCLTQLTPRTRCLDHVIPLARRGKNSYRNLVSCCVDCNSQKGETDAQDFLRLLARQRRLTPAELAERLHKLDALAAGELRPDLAAPQPKSVAGAPKPTPASYNSFPRKGRTPLVER